MGHFELPARDPERAARFLRRAIGDCGRFAIFRHPEGHRWGPWAAAG